MVDEDTTAPGVVGGTPPGRLLVVGGGPAGTAAALMAASVGVPVTLVEAEERTGGALWHITALENVPGGWTSGPQLARATQADLDRLEGEGRCVRVRDRAVGVVAHPGHAEVALATGPVLTGGAVVVATGVRPVPVPGPDGHAQGEGPGWLTVEQPEAPLPAGPVPAAPVPALRDTGPLPDGAHALVLGADRPLGTWLRAHPGAAVTLDVLHPASETYKTAEVAGDPRVRLHEVAAATLTHTADGARAAARRPDGTALTLAAPRVLANLGARPAPPAGSLRPGPDGHCPPASQPRRLFTAGDLRAAGHQRVVTAQGSGAEAALSAYYTYWAGRGRRACG